MKKLNYVVEELKGLNYDFKVIERVNHNLRNTLYREYISFEHDEDDLLYNNDLTCFSYTIRMTFVTKC